MNIEEAIENIEARITSDRKGRADNGGDTGLGSGQGRRTRGTPGTPHGDEPPPECARYG
jgi:hypothetical protein